MSSRNFPNLVQSTHMIYNTPRTFSFEFCFARVICFSVAVWKMRGRALSSFFTSSQSTRVPPQCSITSMKLLKQLQIALWDKCFSCIRCQKHHFPLCLACTGFFFDWRLYNSFLNKTRSFRESASIGISSKPEIASILAQSTSVHGPEISEQKLLHVGFNIF